jgi:hypothetical protein
VSSMGSTPQEDEEPTAEQLQALNNRINVVKAAPYVDFAVWGPYGRKALRSTKFRAYFPLQDGSYMTRELPGPSNYLQWLTSWRVFSAAMIMLGAASHSALTAYERALEKLTRQWPKAWHLITMADDKMRAEHWDRMKRRFFGDESRGSTMAMDWDAAAPWTCVIRLSSEDDRFWNEQVRHPAASWMASGGRSVPLAPEEQIANAHITGGRDALSPEKEAGPGSRTKATRKVKKDKQKLSRNADKEELKKLRAGNGGGNSWPSSTGSGAAETGGKGGKAKGKGRHSVDQAGEQLCFSWNNAKGKCESVPNGQPCPDGRTHKCSICLSPGHRSGACPQGK